MQPIKEKASLSCGMSAAIEQTADDLLDRTRTGKTVWVGVGNTLRGDDAFGPQFVRALGSRVSVPCIDVGVAIENHLGRIARERPETIVIADAVDLGMPPGTPALLGAEEASVAGGLTTHDVALSQVASYLEATTGATVCFLAVQPASLEFGAEMSTPVRESLEALVDRLAPPQEP